MSKTIHIPEGNAFALICKMASRFWQGNIPHDTTINAAELENVRVLVNGRAFEAVELGAEGVILRFGAELPRNTYNVEITAEYNNIAIRAAYFEAVTIVEWNSQSDYQNYVPESPMETDAAYIVAGNWTDAELDELRREYREKNAALDAATAAAQASKEAFDRKAEMLDDVATETAATTNKQAVLDAIDAAKVALQGNDTTATLAALKTAIANIDIDTTTLAKQGTNASATLTATQTAAQNSAQYAEDAKNAVKDGNDTAIGMLKDQTNGLAAIKTQAASAATDAAAAKTAAQGITGYALQGNNSAKTNTQLSAEIADVNSKIGTPASGQPSDLFAAIAAGGSGGGGTVYPTVQMTATTASIDPNKMYVWGEVASLNISLNAGEQGVANVYFLEFYSGSTPTTLVLPASVTDVRGTILANTLMNVAILNGIAYIA